jgi:hypothetical protein
VVDPNGHVLFTREDIVAGQGTFLRNGLMEYGFIFGHGAYLGPDCTADYLHRAAVMSIDFYKGRGSDQASAAAMPISRPIGMIAPVTRSLSLRPKRMPLRDCKAITPLSLPNRPQSMVCALMRSRMPPSDFGLSPLTQGFTHAPQADAAKRSSSPPVPRWFIPTFFLSTAAAQAG